MRLSSGSPAAGAHERPDVGGEPVTTVPARAGFAELLTHGPVEAVEQVVDRRLPQLVLRLEVVVDLWLVRAGGRGDGPGRRALEAVRRELPECGVEERRTGGGGAGLASPRRRW